MAEKKYIKKTKTRKRRTLRVRKNKGVGSRRRLGTEQNVQRKDVGVLAQSPQGSKSTKVTGKVFLEELRALAGNAKHVVLHPTGAKMGEGEGTQRQRDGKREVVQLGGRERIDLDYRGGTRKLSFQAGDKEEAIDILAVREVQREGKPQMDHINTDYEN